MVGVPERRPLFACLFGAALLALPGFSAGQTSSASKAAIARPAVPANPGTLSSWNDLTPAQKVALKPLAGTWSTLSDGHRRKWLALSNNFDTMPPAERATLHSRMTEWAALTPQARSQARLNFGETRQLTAVERKTRWEAYQALTPEEKRRLAESRNTAPHSIAPAVKPVQPQKLAKVPDITAHSHNAPTVVIPTPQVNPHTLLPLAMPTEPASAP